MIFEITFIIASLFQTYIYYLFSVCFYREKAEPKRVFGGCSIFFAVTTIAYLIFNVPVLNFISVVICAFIMICILYGGKISKAVLVTVLTIGMMAVSEALVAICIGAVGVNPVQQNPYYDSIFVTILLPVIQYLIVMIVRNFVSLKNDEVMPKSYCYGVSSIFGNCFYHYFVHKVKSSCGVFSNMRHSFISD